MADQQTRFVIDVDASRGVAAYQRLASAEQKAAGELRVLASAAGTADAAVSKAARSAETYEFASPGAYARRAIPLPRTADGYMRPGRGAAYELAAIARAPTGIGTTGRRYRTDDEAFERFVLAQRIRAERERARIPEPTGLPAETAARVAERASASGRNWQLLGSVVTQASMAVGAAAAGFGAAFDHVAERLDRIGDAGVSFEHEMTPLLSLGDNALRSGLLKQQVLAISGAQGISRESAANSLFWLQSAAGGMGGAGQKEILQASMGMSRTTGSDLQTGLVAVTKLMANYGSEMRTADLAASKLVATEDRAAITMDELGALLPDVLPAAKMLGLSYDEVAASVATATNKLGTNEKTLTGLRELFLKMPEAIRDGTIAAGAWVDELQQLNRLDPVVITKMFGERTVSVAEALATATGVMRQNLEGMAKVTANDNLVKYLERQGTDPAAADATISDSVKQIAANTDVYRAMDPGLRNADLRFKMTSAGYDMNVNPVNAMWDVTGLGKKWAMTKELSTLDPIREAILPDGYDLQGELDSQNEDLKTALQQYIADKQQAGDKQSLFDAHYAQLKFGGAAGTQIYDPTSPTGYRFAGDKDAEEYGRLESRFKGHLGFSEFMELKNDTATNPALGAAFMTFEDKTKGFGTRAQFAEYRKDQASDPTGKLVAELVNKIVAAGEAKEKAAPRKTLNDAVDELFGASKNLNEAADKLGGNRSIGRNNHLPGVP